MTHRVAIVTGAAGGIGSGLCLAFRDAGYRVIGVDIRDASEVCDDFIELDLQQLCSDVDRGPIIQRIASAVPTGLTVLVNNAAVQILGDVDSVEAADFRKTLDVNLLAPFFLSQGLLPKLEAGRGSIVNVGSIHSVLTKPGFVAYATSKAGLSGLTRSMAIDLGSRVRVNAVLPAATGTPMLTEGFAGQPAAFEALAAMHPLRRIATVPEVAAVVLFLASEAASFLTGATIAVDGGIGARLHDPA